VVAREHQLIGIFIKRKSLGYYFTNFPDGTEWVPYVEYSDGSRQCLEDILEETIIELENFFDEIG